MATAAAAVVVVDSIKNDNGDDNYDDNKKNNNSNHFYLYEPGTVSVCTNTAVTPSRKMPYICSCPSYTSVLKPCTADSLVCGVSSYV
jgi:hypothetical protein